MARIRTVKPEFWSSPGLPPDPWARLLYVAMWNWADDHGRGTANERELLGFAFPNDDISLGEFRRALGEVRRAFGVKFYRVAGRPYFEIPTWDKHQKIDKRSGAKHPGPDEGEEFNPDPDLQEHPSSEGPAGSPPNPRRDPGAGIRNRGTGELQTPTVSAAPTDTQRSKSITDAYAAAEPMCKWPAVNGVVLKAIRSERFTDAEIRDALLRLAAEGRSVTVETLRIELAGQPPPSRPNRAEERTRSGLALVAKLEAEERQQGEIA
jgi:hypothetical protein